MMSRRAVVGKLAAGAAVALVTGGARRSSASTTETSGQASAASADVPMAKVAGPHAVDAGPPKTLTTAPPWQLVQPLQAGSAVSQGWSLSELSGVVDGTCVVTLRNANGREHRVHVCRNDGSPQGLVYTRKFDLVVMNGGQGDLPTEEGLAQAVAELAHVVAANENDRQQAPLLTALMPHAERVRLFSGSVDRRLR